MEINTIGKLIKDLSVLPSNTKIDIESSYMNYFNGKEEKRYITLKIANKIQVLITGEYDIVEGYLMTKGKAKLEITPIKKSKKTDVRGVHV